MQLTVRMPDEYGKKLDQVSRKIGLKRADVVRLALRQFLEENKEGPRAPFQKIDHLLGVVESGIKDLGLRHRHYLVQKVRKSS